jgi:Tol biopolymer transport system component
LSPTGTVIRNLTPTGEQGQPSFSPDGKWIVYERDIAPGNNGVWLMRSDGTGLRRVTRNPFRGGDCGCDTDPNFSPDGKLISFVRIKQDERQQALFVVRPNGTGLRQVTPYSWEVATKHDWSPDGKLILLTTNADFVIPGASANLAAIKPNGTGRPTSRSSPADRRTLSQARSRRTEGRSSSDSRTGTGTAWRS